MKDRYVTVYHVTRHYGGPEEGGWWWNRYAPVRTVQIPKVFQKKNKRAVNRVRAMAAKLQDEHKHEEWGNIYHTTGGLLVSVCIESQRREFETKVKPHYE